ncbi:MAG: transglycosylase SLT domain-containing protein [Alistipes sp.]|nr:transglycosylase SLT domain-containing protein [Alistipes sp.]
MLKKVSFVILAVVLASVYESFQGQAQPILAAPTVEEAVAADQARDGQMAVMVELPCVISRFDNIMRMVGAEEGQDWRLMSAIAYSESRFIENLNSCRGAKGIMQIRPVVARHFNVPVESIEQTETNIRLAGMLLAELESMLRIPASTPTTDRLSIILASYNAGIGHVLDARRLARSEGANPNSWSDVSRYLRLMSDPAYYEQDVVQSGKFTGSGQTLSYVNEVMSKYAQYCKIATLA